MKTFIQNNRPIVILAAIVLVLGILVLFISLTHGSVFSGSPIAYGDRIEKIYGVKLLAHDNGIVTVLNSDGKTMLCHAPAFLDRPLLCSGPGITIEPTK